LETLRKTLKYFNVNNSIFSSWDSRRYIEYEKGITIDISRRCSREKLINIKAALDVPISYDYDLILPPDKFVNKDALYQNCHWQETLPCRSYTPNSTHVCSVTKLLLPFYDLKTKNRIIKRPLLKHKRKKKIIQALITIQAQCSNSEKLLRL
jgi:hypothetical protein